MSGQRTASRPQLLMTRLLSDVGGPLLELPPGADGRVAREASRIRARRRAAAEHRAVADVLAQHEGRRP